MSWVTLNGIALDSYLAHNGFREEASFVVGAEQRALDGGHRQDVAKRKRRWSGLTVPVTSEIKEALAGMCGGFGDSFSFDLVHSTAPLDSRRGVLLGGAGGGGSGTTYSKFGGRSLEVSSGTRTAALKELLAPEWTVFGWQLNGSLAFDHWIDRSDAASWKNGAADAGVPDWTVSGGVLTFPVGWFDDVVAVPFLLPSSWVAQMYAAHGAASLVPWHLLRLGGDFFGGEAITVRPTFLGASAVRAADSIRHTCTLMFEEV